MLSLNLTQEQLGLPIKQKLSVKEWPGWLLSLPPLIGLMALNMKASPFVNQLLTVWLQG